MLRRIFSLVMRLDLPPKLVPQIRPNPCLLYPPPLPRRPTRRSPADDHRRTSTSQLPKSFNHDAGQESKHSSAPSTSRRLIQGRLRLRLFRSSPVIPASLYEPLRPQCSLGSDRFLGLLNAATPSIGSVSIELHEDDAFWPDADSDDADPSLPSLPPPPG